MVLTICKKCGMPAWEGKVCANCFHKSVWSASSGELSTTGGKSVYIYTGGFASQDSVEGGLPSHLRPASSSDPAHVVRSNEFFPDPHEDSMLSSMTTEELCSLAGKALQIVADRAKKA